VILMLQYLLQYCLLSLGVRQFEQDLKTVTETAGADPTAPYMLCLAASTGKDRQPRVQEGRKAGPEA
jgi:hypothetical protein